MADLDTFARLAASLPTMPEVAQQLIRSFERDDLSLRELADLVARDGVLAARVLRTANSARYSPGRQITTLDDAAAMLGLNQLRDLTLAASLTGTLPSVNAFDRRAFWRGSLAVAAYAHSVARAIDLDHATAYVAGLMLRTGQILMAMGDAEGFQRAADHGHQVDTRFVSEFAVFGFTHATVTSELARCWQFPTSLITAFSAAGDPLACLPFDELGAVLRLASVITDAREAGDEAPSALVVTQSDLLQRLNLDALALEHLLPSHVLATAGVDALLH